MLLLSFPPAPVHAAPVTLNFSYSVDGGGSPTVPTLTYVTGGSQTTVPLTATQTPYYADPGTAWSVSPNPLTGSGSSERWDTSITTSGTATADQTTVFIYYHQYQPDVSYSVVGGGAPTAPLFSCLRFGSAFAYTATTTPTAEWLDSGCPYSFPNPLGSSGSSERWDANGGTSGTVSGSAALAPAFYHQYSATLSYSVLGGGGPTAPTLTSTEFGAAYAPAITTSPTVYWLDSSTSWSLTNPLGGSGSTERWETNSGTSGTVSGPSTQAPSYYHQSLYTLSYLLVGGGTPAAPLLTSTQFGAQYAPPLTNSPTGYWLDYSAACSTSNPTTGSTSTERWDTAVSCPTVSSAQTISFAYYHQYSLTLSYRVSGGGSGYATPSLSYVEFGTSASAPLQPTSTQVWGDSGSSWSVPDPLQGSTGAERWASNQSSSASVSGSLTSILVYYHQYYLAFAYSIAGGGAGYSPPTVSFSRFGNSVNGTGGWADSGVLYSYTDPLAGSSPTERWYSNSAQGTVSTATTVNATFYHQYSFLMSFNVLGGGSGFQSPGLLSSAFGSVTSQSLTGTPAAHWLDAGTRWGIDGQLLGSTPSERWKTTNETSGVVSTSATLALDYYHQYLVGLSYSIVGGGTPAPPTLQFVSFGSANSTAMPSHPVSFWGDSGSRWSLPQLLSGSNSDERWIANGTSSAAIVRSFTSKLVYLHQYFVAVGANEAAGGEFSNVTGWFDKGTYVTLDATALPGWKFMYWSGAGPSSYNGTDPKPLISVEAASSEAAIFYPGLTIATDSQGSVAYSFGSTAGNVTLGSQQVVYVPPGSNVTLKAVPANPAIVFSDWSQGTSGSDPTVSVYVQGPTSVRASFTTDYPDIQVLAVALLVVVVLSAYVFFVRRAPKRTPLPSTNLSELSNI